MAGDSTWEPILDGTLAATARQAVRDVAQAIKDGVGVPARPTDRTLFWAYVAGAIEEDWVTECYDASTDDLAASIAKFGGFIGLHGGLAGVGWVISHVVMGIIYYLVITPIALIFKLIGRDALQRGIDENAKTYWVEHRTGGDPKRYFKQF